MKDPTMNKELKPKIIVTQKPEQEPIPAKIIADSIVEIAKGMKLLNTTRLRRKTIIALLHDNTKMGKRDIEIVLDNLLSLEEDWLKP